MTISEAVHNLSEPTKHALDWAAILAAVGSVASVFPWVASFFTVVWLGVRIWVALLEAKDHRLSIKLKERQLQQRERDA
jgi:hypothetical protein